MAAVKRYRAACKECGQDRIVEPAWGVCKNCQGTTLAVPDDQSPNVLDMDGWVNDRGIMRHRDSFGRTA
jgi:Zn finger protein HypA/HybF involved in hydrogenase expression